MAGSQRSSGPPAAGPQDREVQVPPPDRSPWHWLLLVPIVIVLIPPIFNRSGPELGGIPFFYWYQLAVIAVGVSCTVAVYLRTGRR